MNYGSTEIKVAAVHGAQRLTDPYILAALKPLNMLRFTVHLGHFNSKYVLSDDFRGGL